MKYIKENLQLFSDLVAINSGFLILRWTVLENPGTAYHIPLLIVLANLIWVSIYFIRGKQNVNRHWNYIRHILELFKFFALHYVALLILDIAVFENANRDIILGVYVSLIAPLLISRITLVYLLRTIRSRGYNYKRIVAVGESDFIDNFSKEMDAQSHFGYKLLASFDSNLSIINWVGNGDKKVDFYDFLIDREIDEVFLSVHSKKDKVHPLLTFCKLNGIVVNIAHDFLDGFKLDPLDISVQKNGLTPTLTIKEDWFTSLLRINAKRVFDVLLASIATLLIASWLFPIIALLIKLDSRGPILFLQRRTGINNQNFVCFKFRTMALINGTKKVTRVGKVLRKLSLDELPQLFNVLRGDMSVVGPRPHMLSHTKEYGSMVENYHERLWIKPGITGLAQSMGFRGEIKEIDQLEGRIDYDRDYVKNWSFSLDLKIIAFTLWNIVSFQKMGV